MEEGGPVGGKGSILAAWRTLAELAELLPEYLTQAGEVKVMECDDHEALLLGVELVEQQIS